MGKVSLAKQIKKLFSDPENFDISGMMKADLVTVELAEALWHIGKDDFVELRRDGFWFDYFEADRRNGIIGKLFEDRRKKTAYALRLYYDQKYPKEILQMKGASADGN